MSRAKFPFPFSKSSNLYFASLLNNKIYPPLLNLFILKRKKFDRGCKNEFSIALTSDFHTFDWILPATRRRGNLAVWQRRMQKRTCNKSSSMASFGRSSSSDVVTSAVTHDFRYVTADAPTLDDVQLSS